ncbi:TIGR04141 family sporadically distributed protein [Burkholderia pseudomallei]|uniref:TIGR04141 family sporadically distributed protein n=1 Tax=Burkholderia pseudomallei TaxID=28450 RepID=UPI000B1B5AA8|nr:TIGR04141 family sporadically distributed protein [Burkholderia pseudomallei]MBF3905864.1 TIGR04141 family sporadically distributed protein [Burkholderia pseudomallei]
MPAEKHVNHLTVFLIKKQYDKCKQVIRTDVCDTSFSIEFSGYGEAELHIKHQPPHPPKWTALFNDFLDLSDIVVPGISAALFLKVGERCFVLTFGQGGRFLLQDEVFEERFGLLCALNSVDQNSFRCVDVQSLDAIQSHTRIQSGQETSANQFGLDVEQDMLKAIVGAPVVHALGNRMTGSDSLTVSVKMDLADLPFLLDEYRKKFEEDLSVEDYQWVNNISIVKNSKVIGVLEAELNGLLGLKTFDNIWLSIPEIIDWTSVCGFMYSHGKNIIHHDIDWSGFISTLGKDESIDLDLLRSREVHCADEDHKKVYRSWKVYKCLYAEIDVGGEKYILNDGKWYKVANDFVARTNDDFGKIPISKLKFPDYKGGGEGAYNAEIAKSNPSGYALLDDKNKIMHGGGHGQVEVCDLLSINRELIHVKIYSKSSVMSHLFAQGFVSGQLIQTDSKFREKILSKLDGDFKNIFQVNKNPEKGEFTIVYAVISEEPGEALYLPFFSRVNLNNTRKILVGFGYNVELLKISVDEMYAKTTEVPKNKKGKHG